MYPRATIFVPKTYGSTPRSRSPTVSAMAFAQMSSTTAPLESITLPLYRRRKDSCQYSDLFTYFAYFGIPTIWLLVSHICLPRFQDSLSVWPWESGTLGQGTEHFCIPWTRLRLPVPSVTAISNQDRFCFDQDACVCPTNVCIGPPRNLMFHTSRETCCHVLNADAFFHTIPVRRLCS